MLLKFRTHPKSPTYPARVSCAKAFSIPLLKMAADFRLEKLNAQSELTPKMLFERAMTAASRVQSLIANHRGSLPFGDIYRRWSAALMQCGIAHI